MAASQTYLWRHSEALIDTGASESCIDSALAVALSLPIVGLPQKSSGIGGQGIHNVHLAQIYVPSLHFSIYGRFLAVHLSAGGQPYHALSGRTFLLHCSMTYDVRTGTVVIEK